MSRLRRRRPEAQDRPDDSVVPQLHEEVHDGVGRRRAPLCREAPQGQHLLAVLVEVGAVSSTAWQTKSGNFAGDEADASEDDSSSESEDAPDAPLLSPGNDATWAIVEL